MVMQAGEDALLVEREILLKKVAELSARLDAINEMEKALLASLDEVRSQLGYYEALEREIKSEVHPAGVQRMMRGMKGE